MPSNPTVSVALLVAVAILVALLGGLIAARLRAWSRSDHAAEPFTLQDLRNLRASGQITPQEFETMRAALLGRWAAAAPAQPEAQPPGPSPDQPDAGA